MAVDRTSLITRFPAFADAPTTLVDLCIAEAVSRTDAGVWGDRVDQGVNWLAAHLIAINPEYNGGGKCACDSDGATTFLKERRRLARVVAGGPWGAWCP